MHTLHAMLFGSSLSESEVLNHAVDKHDRADQDNKHSSAVFQQGVSKFKVEFSYFQ